MDFSSLFQQRKTSIHSFINLAHYRVTPVFSSFVFVYLDHSRNRSHQSVHIYPYKITFTCAKNEKEEKKCVEKNLSQR